MSMMTPEDNQDAEIKKVGVNATTVVKRVTSKFFAHPVHYIFYVTLSGIIVGLFGGYDFSWKLYTALFVLGGAEIYLSYFHKDNAGTSKQ